MDRPATDPHLAAHRHDAVLLLALGVESVTRRLTQELDTPGAPQDALSPDDPVVLAALGILSVTRTLSGWLDAAAPQAPAPPAEHAAPAPPEDLLR